MSGRSFGVRRWIRSQTIDPSLRRRPFRQLRNCSGTLAFIHVNPDTLELVQVSSQAKATAGPLKGLCLGTGPGVLVVSPLFSGCRMRSKPKDRHFTSDDDFRRGLLLFAAQECRTGVDFVFPRPSRGCEELIEAVRVCALICVWHHLTAGRSAFASIG